MNGLYDLETLVPVDFYFVAKVGLFDISVSHYSFVEQLPNHAK